MRRCFTRFLSRKARGLKQAFIMLEPADERHSFVGFLVCSGGIRLIGVLGAHWTRFPLHFSSFSAILLFICVSLPFPLPLSPPIRYHQQQHLVDEMTPPSCNLVAEYLGIFLIPFWLCIPTWTAPAQNGKERPSYQMFVYRAFPSHYSSQLTISI